MLEELRLLGGGGDSESELDGLRERVRFLPAMTADLPALPAVEFAEAFDGLATGAFKELFFSKGAGRKGGADLAPTEAEEATLVAAVFNNDDLAGKTIFFEAALEN